MSKLLESLDFTDGTHIQSILELSNLDLFDGHNFLS